MVKAGASLQGRRVHPGPGEREQWGLIGPETPEGREYLRELDKLRNAAGLSRDQLERLEALERTDPGGTFVQDRMGTGKSRYRTLRDMPPKQRESFARRFNRLSGAPGPAGPEEEISDASRDGQTPHGRVEGRTWELFFDLPWPKNTGSTSRKKPVQARHQKRATVKTTRKAIPKHRQNPTPARVEAKHQDRLEYDRQRNQNPERKEQQRLHAKEKRLQAKEAGLCRHCSEPAIPGQTRCETCAENHRQYRRRSKARSDQKREQASRQGRSS